MTIRASYLKPDSLGGNKTRRRRTKELSQDEARERLRCSVFDWQERHPEKPTYRTASIFMQAANKYNGKYDDYVAYYDLMQWAQGYNT